MRLEETMVDEHKKYRSHFIFKQLVAVWFHQSVGSRLQIENRLTKTEGSEMNK